MTEDHPSSRPNATPRALADRDARQAREAEALRANLHRRKAQTRARQDQSKLPPDLPDSTDLS